MITARTKPGRGFTLVELLVVITIIGLLVAIMVPAVSIVLNNTKNARIAMEINSLAQAIEAYKVDAGDYPPDFTDAARVRRHIAKRWQQIPASEVTGILAYVDATPGSRVANELDPDEALVFWLGGNTKVRLKANDVMPFSGTGEPKVYFEFDEGRLVDLDGDGWMEYSSPYGSGAPYVYFDSRSYAGFYSGTGYDASSSTDAYGIIKPSPRRASVTTQDDFVNPTTFQIIAAGQDGKFGGGGSTYPDGPYTDSDKDNIANFTDGKTFEDARP